MMRPTHATLLTATLLAPGCEPEAHRAPGYAPLCGDGVQVEGEVCLAYERLPSLYPPRHLVRGDFDGDGVRELYTNDPGSPACIFLGERDGEFVETGRWRLDNTGEEWTDEIYNALVHDFDRDGRDDVFALWVEHYWSGHVLGKSAGGLMLLNRGWTAFATDIRFRHEGEPPPDGLKEARTSVAAGLGDFDGDGVMDVFASPNPRSGLVFVHAPDAATVYAVARSYDFTALGIDDWYDRDHAVPTVADLDEDGFDDLVLVDSLGEVWVLRGDPNLDLEPVQLAGQPALAPETDLVLVEDVDGDGEQDLVGVGIQDDYDSLQGPWRPSTVSLARGEGGGRFSPVVAFPTRSEVAGTVGGAFTGTFYPRAALLDLDGSGYPALVYALANEHSLVVHPQFGLRLGGGAVEYPLIGEPTGVFADPRDDGGVDLLVPVHDDRGTPDEWEDDGRYIERWRPDP